VIDRFVTRFMNAEGLVREKLRTSPPHEYKDLVKLVVETVRDEDEYDSPDPGRIHEINDGDYQGTLVYVIGANGYQPSTYWAVTVGYGSCSGCDTLQSILDYRVDDDPLNDEEVNKLWTLAFHVVQRLRDIS